MPLGRVVFLWLLALSLAIVGWAAFWSAHGGPICADAGMPCMPLEDALRQAYQYCREDYFRPGGEWCIEDQNGRSATCDLVNHSESYTLPACEKIVKRWESSPWKKADDDADAAMKKRALDHAKAFIEAIPP